MTLATPEGGSGLGSRKCRWTLVQPEWADLVGEQAVAIPDTLSPLLPPSRNILSVCFDFGACPALTQS